MESQVFAVRFLCPSSSKRKFTVPPKNILFLNYCTSKILIFYFFCTCAKNGQSHKKCSSKARYEISTIKLVLKSCQTLAKKLLHNLHFCTFFVFPQVKTQFSLSQNNILVIENHLPVA